MKKPAILLVIFIIMFSCFTNIVSASKDMDIAPYADNTTRTNSNFYIDDNQAFITVGYLGVENTICNFRL